MLAIITFQFFKRNSLIIHAQFKIFIPEYSVKHVLFNELLKKNVREYAKKNAIFFVLREAKRLKKLQDEQVWEVQREQSEAENHSAIVSEVFSPVARPQVEEESVGGQREMEDPDGEAEEEELYTDPQEAFDDFFCAPV